MVSLSSSSSHLAQATSTTTPAPHQTPSPRSTSAAPVEDLTCTIQPPKLHANSQRQAAAVKAPPARFKSKDYGRFGFDPFQVKRKVKSNLRTLKETRAGHRRLLCRFQITWISWGRAGLSWDSGAPCSTDLGRFGFSSVQSNSQALHCSAL